MNSGALNDRGTNKLAGQIVKQRFAQPMMGNQPWNYAESMALIRAFVDQADALPKELTMYIDRDTYDCCEKLLPGVLEHIGVDEVLIIMKSGKRIPISKGPMRLGKKR